jgi:hypothetical protein
MSELCAMAQVADSGTERTRLKREQNAEREEKKREDYLVGRGAWSVVACE